MIFNRLIFVAVTIVTIGFALTACAEMEYNAALPSEAGFHTYTEGLRHEALKRGISAATVNQVFDHLIFMPRSVDQDRKQPEKKLTFDDYRQRIVSPTRIKKGREMYDRYYHLLQQVSARYGVAPQYIVALWGTETNYGGYTGNFNIPSALATLAYEGRREDFFKKEFFDALKIIDDGHIDHAHMTGSWAGAMGQNQFMPSSFHNFAVDFNGDGRRDIWGTTIDVFASTANYLSKSGWRGDEKWGREVRVPANFNPALMGRDIKKPLREWAAMGVRTIDGRPIPVVDGLMASVVAPDGPGGVTFLTYNNYDVFMKWNRSLYFATSVGLLADSIVNR